MTQGADILIAGGGPAAILAAARIARTRPEARIVVLEKDAALGGRLRATDHHSHFTYGLNFISPALFEFWNGTLKADPESPDLPHFTTGRFATAGVLAASHLTEVPVTELFSPTGFKAVAGPAGGRDWTKWAAYLDGIASDERKDANFHHVFKSDRQAPAAIALGHMLRAGGVTDLMSANATAVAIRARMLGEGWYAGRWEEALGVTLRSCASTVSVVTQCRIIGAARGDAGWTLTTEQGPFTAPILIVAQTPWDTGMWLPKDEWPQPLVSLVNHVQPVSVLALNLTLGRTDAIPDLMLIPAEEVQIVKTASNEVCLQATIDFELTFEAPAVVKAVRRLRRARKKLEQFLPECHVSDEHLALLPAAWVPPVAHSDHRFVERLRKGDFQKPDLMFCGDAYGPDYDGDKNLIQSVLAAETKLAGRPRHKVESTLSLRETGEAFTFPAEVDGPNGSPIDQRPGARPVDQTIVSG